MTSQFNIRKSVGEFDARIVYRNVLIFVSLNVFGNLSRSPAEGRADLAWAAPYLPARQADGQKCHSIFSRNKPICRQLQPYRLHFRNSGSKQITHLKDNCYTIYLLTNLLEKNQKTLSTKLPVYSLWEPNLPYQIKIAHLFMRSITKCPCYLKCQGLVNHEITRQRRNTES